MNYTTATTDEIREAGIKRGYNVASWQDLPEIGDTLPRDVDWVGIGTVDDVNDAAEAFGMLAHAAEEHDRCFSPFEFTAKEINDRDDADDAWEAFDAGIQDGIAKCWEERKGYYED